MAQRPGPLLLVGGNEFRPGNEPQDRALAAWCGDRPAHVVVTAAVRHDPEAAVRHAVDWFAALDLPMTELPMRTRTQAKSASTVEAARAAGATYLCGGDPGIVVTTLRDTHGWEALVGAWRDGAALAGSSAGAMALGEWTLLKGRMPGDHERRYADALNLVPGRGRDPALGRVRRHLGAIGRGRAAASRCRAARPRLRHRRGLGRYGVAGDGSRPRHRHRPRRVASHVPGRGDPGSARAALRSRRVASAAHNGHRQQSPWLARARHASRGQRTGDPGFSVAVACASCKPSAGATGPRGRVAPPATSGLPTGVASPNVAPSLQRSDPETAPQHGSRAGHCHAGNARRGR